MCVFLSRRDGPAPCISLLRRQECHLTRFFPIAAVERRRPPSKLGLISKSRRLKSKCRRNVSLRGEFQAVVRGKNSLDRWAPVGPGAAYLEMRYIFRAPTASILMRLFGVKNRLQSLKENHAFAHSFVHHAFKICYVSSQTPRLGQITPIT